MHSCTAALELSALLLDLGPGRRGDHALVHVRLDRHRVRAARRQAGVRRHPPRHAEPRRVARRGRDHRRARGRSSPSTTPASPARWTADHGDRRRAWAAARRGRRPGDLCAPTTAGRSARSGHLGAFSFHETKNFTCGEGGALIVNDERYRRAGGDPARQGHQPQQLLPRRGRPVHLARPRLLLCAQRPRCGFLLPQLQDSEAITRERRRCGMPTRRRLRQPRRRALQAPDGPAKREQTPTCTTCCCPAGAAATS